MILDRSKILEMVTAAGIKAGKAIMDIYATDFESSIQLKKDASPVTLADKTASDLITCKLSGLIPNCPVLSEESAIPPFEERQKLERYWLIDPLDGTKEFIARNGDFTVNIALIENNIPVFGWVLNVVSGEYYHAFDGDLAYHHIDGKMRPIQSKPFAPDQKGLRILRSRSHFSQKAADYISHFSEPELVARGSSIKMMLVAKGEADLYPCFSRTKEWDTAASQVILESAGGQLIDFETHSPLKYNKKDLTNPFFLASGTKK
jgi:3'(2'), 5'-bisphosphate nucleotidase